MDSIATESLQNDFNKVIQEGSQSNNVILEGAKRPIGSGKSILFFEFYRDEVAPE
ncbi:MAG: hypothetical protein MJY87_02735 [Fibrobacter sp.]|nr:hypothetical protein [Fibrobacter sp.]